MGAGACKDKVFVLDLNVVYLLNSLDSRASEPKVMRLTLPRGFNFLLCDFERDTKEIDNLTNLIWLRKRATETLVEGHCLRVFEN